VDWDNTSNRAHIYIDDRLVDHLIEQGFTDWYGGSSDERPRRDQAPGKRFGSQSGSWEIHRLSDCPNIPKLAEAAQGAGREAFRSRQGERRPAGGGQRKAIVDGMEIRASRRTWKHPQGFPLTQGYKEFVLRRSQSEI